VPLGKSNGTTTGENWAIIIGISYYKDSKLNLNYAHKDAEDLYNILMKSNGGFFKEDNVVKLLNEDASYFNIRKALRNFLKKPARDDLVLIYFSCHGGIDHERPLISYILPHDTDPGDISTTGLPMREIGDSIRENLLSQKIIIIADACHSAGIGEAIATRNINSPAARINKFLQTLANSTNGIALFTSAEANEVAFEDKRWGNGHGVFTHFLLEGIRGKADGYGGGETDGVISIGELFEYVRDNVKESTDNKQHPSIGTSRYDRNLPLAITSYTIVTTSSTNAATSSNSWYLSQKERLEYIITLLKNGQIDEFNTFRKKDDQPIFLPNIDLSGKNLQGIDFQDAILSRSKFKKANMRGANLTGTKLTRADMSEADLSSAILSGSILREAKLIGANLRGTELKGMIDFSKADLSHADLRGVNLEGIVNFEDAKLYDLDFTSLNRETVLLYLKGADIRNVKSLKSKTESSSNKYSNALKKFSKNISDLFNKFDISIDGKRSVEEAVNQLVNVIESISSFELIKNKDKDTLANKIRNLIQEIVKVLPLEIQLSDSISNSFTDLSPFNEFLKESKNMIINEMIEYEITQVKTPKDAFALNRAGYGEKAEKILLSLIEKKGPSSETYGLLGRVYKDRWEKEYNKEENEEIDNNDDNEFHASDAYLDQAINAYLKGFETDWRDTYPGINAVTLMEIKRKPDPQRTDLIPVVKYSVERKMAKGKPDYWDYATLLELAILAKDKEASFIYLAKALSLLRERWEGETTLRNLRMIREAREKRNELVPWTKKIEESIEKKIM
jgi:uncharacterized protein YjbI with pentapeptide repeats